MPFVITDKNIEKRKEGLSRVMAVKPATTNPERVESHYDQFVSLLDRFPQAGSGNPPKTRADFFILLRSPRTNARAADVTTPSLRKLLKSSSSE